MKENKSHRGSVNNVGRIIGVEMRVPDEFEIYWEGQKVLALAKICDEEHLDKEQFKALIDAYIFSGRDPLRNEVLNAWVIGQAFSSERNW